MDKLMEILESTKKPEMKLAYDFLAKYKDCDYYVKPNLDLNKLHRIWHYGVVANIKCKNHLFVISACGCRNFILKNTLNDNVITCKTTNNDSFFNGILGTVLKSDEDFLNIKDGLIDTDLKYIPILNNYWSVKVYDQNYKVVNTIKLVSEFLYEALEELNAYISEYIDFVPVQSLQNRIKRFTNYSPKHSVFRTNKLFKKQIS